MGKGLFMVFTRPFPNPLTLVQIIVVSLVSTCPQLAIAVCILTLPTRTRPRLNKVAPQDISSGG